MSGDTVLVPQCAEPGGECVCARACCNTESGELRFYSGRKIGKKTQCEAAAISVRSTLNAHGADHCSPLRRLHGTRPAAQVLTLPRRRRCSSYSTRPPPHHHHLTTTHTRLLPPTSIAAPSLAARRTITRCSPHHFLARAHILPRGDGSARIFNPGDAVFDRLPLRPQDHFFLAHVGHFQSSSGTFSSGGERQ